MIYGSHKSQGQIDREHDQHWASRTREQNIADYVNEIARDSWTLNNVKDPAPSVEFYIRRIAEYQQEVMKLRGGK